MSDLIADRGDNNIFDLDLSTPIDVADKLWFTAKRRYSDDDTLAVVKLGTTTSGLSGISLSDGPNGKAQIIIPTGTLVSVPDEALIYDVQLKRASDNFTFTVQKGIMRLIGQVTLAG
jgi:hypothetical protein